VLKLAKNTKNLLTTKNIGQFEARISVAKRLASKPGLIG